MVQESAPRGTGYERQDNSILSSGWEGDCSGGNSREDIAIYTGWACAKALEYGMIALWDRVKSIGPSDVEHGLMWGEEQGPGIAGGAIPSINKLVSGVYGGEIRGGVIAYIPVEPPAQGEVGVVLLRRNFPAHTRRQQRD